MKTPTRVEFVAKDLAERARSVDWQKATPELRAHYTEMAKVALEADREWRSVNLRVVV